MADETIRRCVELHTLTSAYRRIVSKPLQIDLAPVLHAVAAAHLVLAYPDGFVVMLKAKRGPRGGLGSPRFVRSGHVLPNRSQYTYHIAWEVHAH